MPRSYTVTPLHIKVSVMFKKSTHKVLLRYCGINKVAILKWVAVGFAASIPAWVWGDSPITAWVLKMASGFGWPLVVLTCMSIVLAVMAFFLKGRVGRLAYEGFRYALRWVHPKLLRATSVLWGMVVIAAICWCVTGSGNALGTALIGLLLSSTLFWWWSCLAVIADELSKRSFMLIV